MNIGWTYSGHSVSLLEFVDEINANESVNTDIYRVSPKSNPNTDCDVMTAEFRQFPQLSWLNQVLIRYNWKQFLRKHLNTDLDILLTENVLGPASVDIANKHDIPSVIFIRSLLIIAHEIYNQNDSTYKNFLKTDFGGKVQFPFLMKSINEFDTAFEKANVVIANSEYTAEKIQNLFGIESELIYPPIKLDQYRVDYNPDGKITMVNPRAEYKGADIFLDIAEAMPNRDFLVAGSTDSDKIEERMRTLDNVEHLGWQQEMKRVYQRTKLLIVPSRFKEPFGRVAAEAMTSGIPCVVSNHGGLPEIIGDTGQKVDNIESVNTWIDAVTTLLDTDSVAERERRQERAQKFSMEKQSEKLYEILNRLG